MAISDSFGNLGDVWPPGFRFHPTDEELVLYYLKRKICCRKIKLDIVGVLDVYKREPEELPGLSLLKTGDRQWFFFSPRDRKYPNGSRSNRATRHGYWKATGKDRNISCNARNVGLKKTLVFHKGRAPNGERTDWVMHEYTLNEEEIKKCQDVQEYYALYKVFKKSGPGPKNGEQYGAPFREEDWADDKHPEVSNYSDPDSHVKQLNVVAPQNECNDELLGKITWSDIEDFMSKMADDPLPEGTTSDHYVNVLPQVCGGEGLSSMSDGRAAYVDPQPCPSFSQYYNEGSINLTMSTTSQMPLHGVSEVSSMTNVANLNDHVAEEDFLEMDDLLTLEPVNIYAGQLHGPQTFSGEIINPHPSGDKSPENAPWGDLDGLSELDLYYDARMFLRELGPVDSSAIASYQPVDGQESKIVNAGSVEEALPPCDLNNYSSVEMAASNMNGFAPKSSQNSLGSMPISGVCGGIFTPKAMESSEHENRSGKGVEGAENWYTSALWSFVESIPTAPASAADSALVNRAFERMSSFGRLRVINAKSTTASLSASDTTGSAVASCSWGGRTSSSCGAREEETGGRMKGGFFLLSFLGAVFAVLFVLIGSLSKIMRAHEYLNS